MKTVSDLPFGKKCGEQGVTRRVLTDSVELVELAQSHVFLSNEDQMFWKTTDDDISINNRQTERERKIY